MLSDKNLSLEDILKIADHPFRLCPTCEGECIAGVGMAMTEEGILMIPLPCPDCGGMGQILYASNS
jgi:DnaJ-class molecular chaperone